jgi:hypothetical protein
MRPLSLIYFLCRACVALEAVRTDNPEKLANCFAACAGDEINTSVSVGLVGYGLRFHYVYDVPLSLRMGMALGETLLDMAHRKRKSPALRAALRKLGCRAVVAAAAEEAEVEELRRKARKAQLQAEGRV